MWHSIKYLYYKLFKLFVRINGQDDLPEYTAMLGLGTLFFLNMLSIVSILNVVYPFTMFPSISRASFFVSVGIPYIIILYFVFVFNGKYKRITNEFINESEDDRKKGRRKVVYYMLFSLLFLIFSLILMIMQNEGGI
ncbi:MAG: hypothetical protein IPJ16_02160 [Bacteroidales bacterium]|nr:hypothetical protein [Bacteroidales bacterium]